MASEYTKQMKLPTIQSNFLKTRNPAAATLHNSKKSLQQKSTRARIQHKKRLPFEA